MVTIIDVAKKAGVSISTVSNVINHNGKTKKTTEAVVLQAIEDLGYVPNTIAKGLKSKHTNTIGILVEDITTFIAARIIDGICEYAEQHDYTIILYNLRVDRKVESVDIENYHLLEHSAQFQHLLRENLTLALSSKVSGLIYIGTYPRDITNLLPDLDIPVVYCYSYASEGSGKTCVYYDDFQGAKTAVDYILSLGHRRVGMISGSINSIPTHKRMVGYQTALLEQGIPFCPEYVKVGKWRYEDGYANCKELLSLPEPPTAIFAMSDIMAGGAINAATDMGINVPEQLSVHGFDNLELSAFIRPSLTTMDLPLHQIGLTAAKEIICRINGQESSWPSNNILLPCKHVIRQSVKNDSWDGRNKR